MSDEKLPIGTRIRFVKELHEGATGDHPALLYAREGEEGEVTGHNNFEGHMVKADSWPHPFGARHGDEFEAIAVNNGKADEPVAPVVDEVPISETPEPMPPSLEAVGRMTNARAARVAERCNFQVTGYVMTHRTLGQKAIVDSANVRWYPNMPDFMLMMTGKKDTPGPGIQPPEADGDDLIGGAQAPDVPPPGPYQLPAPKRPLLTAPPSARLLESVEDALGEIARELGCGYNDMIPHNAGWFVPGMARAYASALDAIKGLFASLKAGGTAHEGDAVETGGLSLSGELVESAAAVRPETGGQRTTTGGKGRQKAAPEPENLPQLGLF